MCRKGGHELQLSICFLPVDGMLARHLQGTGKMGHLTGAIPIDGAKQPQTPMQSLELKQHRRCDTVRIRSPAQSLESGADISEFAMRPRLRL